MKVGFLEAVRMLDRGEVNEIVSPTGTKVRMSASGFMTDGGVNYFGSTEVILNEWEVFPKPRTETKDVVRWVCATCGDLTTEKMDICVNGHNTIARLTGTLTVEVPRKERKRWVLEDCGFNKNCSVLGQYHALFPFAEGVPTGKTGRLVYEYED